MGWGILFPYLSISMFVSLSITFWVLLLILLNNLSEGSHYLAGIPDKYCFLTLVSLWKHLLWLCFGEAIQMSAHKICFHGEIRKISVLFGWKKSTLSRIYSILDTVLCPYVQTFVRKQNFTTLSFHCIFFFFILILGCIEGRGFKPWCKSFPTFPKLKTCYLYQPHLE